MEVKTLRTGQADSLAVEVTEDSRDRVLMSSCPMHVTEEASCPVCFNRPQGVDGTQRTSIKASRKGCTPSGSTASIAW
jgi:hypothetical protein